MTLTEKLLLNFNELDEAEQQELVDLGLSTADKKYSEEDIFNWIVNHKA